MEAAEHDLAGNLQQRGRFLDGKVDQIAEHQRRSCVFVHAVQRVAQEPGQIGTGVFVGPRHRGRFEDALCVNAGLPSDATELLTLMEADIRPLEMLLLGDDELAGLVERMREELGDV